MPQYDAVVVGSGPAGYTAALYLGRAGRTVAVFEGRATAGGALMDSGEVENYPGFPDGTSGPELMAGMRRQAERFGVDLHTSDVSALDLTPGRGGVVDDQGDAHHTRSVILATGSRRRRLGVPGEGELSGRGVSACATCDGYFFRGRDVVVVGGGDAAAEEALLLSRLARRVQLVHRSGRLRASHVNRRRLQSCENVSVTLSTRVIGVEGRERVTGILMENLTTGELSALSAEAVFVAIGSDPRTELVRGLVQLDRAGHIVVDHPSMRTSRPGVFACGDVVDPTYRQAVVAAGTGCVAGLDAEQYLVATGGFLEPVEEVSR